MNRSTGFRNKLIYLSIMIAMLIPLYLLGQPAGGSTGDAGGQLTQMRTKYNIAESELGDINPASETMKLASLGLRGVAATLLWNKAHDYRVYHEWDRLKATLNNIALLQPHYEKVWEYQAHNLAYNVSTEFDDYRQRYAMVREGTEFLTKGVEQNRKAPRLVWYTGWFYGQKMGMSDEKKQFRRLFADDDVLHQALRDQDIEVDSPTARGPDGKPDNWLVGRLWLFHGYDIVDNGVKIRNQTPLNFFETGPKWRIKHAEAIESEGVLDDRAKNAWQQAGDDWNALGTRSIPTTAAFTIKLASLDELTRQLSDTRTELMDLVKDSYEEEKKAIYDSFTEEERTAWETKEEDRTQEQKNLAYALSFRMEPALTTVAKKAPPAARLRAIELASQISDLEARIQKTEGHRKQINYEYWSTLTKAEQEDRTVQARRLLFEAEKANADADLDLAIAKYEEAFELWAKVFDDYPVLTLDDLSDDLMRAIRRYTIAIDQEEFDEDFPLLNFVQLMSGEDRSAEEYDRLRKLQAEKLKEKEEAAIKAEAEALKAAETEAPDAPAEPADAPAEEAEMKETEPAAEPGEASETPTPAEEAPAAEETPDPAEEVPSSAEAPATEDAPAPEDAPAVQEEPAGESESSDGEAPGGASDSR
jgi:hypothetical protein